MHVTDNFAQPHAHNMRLPVNAMPVGMFGVSEQIKPFRFQVSFMSVLYIA
jgi:hypothetical protein